jgi:cell division protein FtsQ
VKKKAGRSVRLFTYGIAIASLGVAVFFSIDLIRTTYSDLQQYIVATAGFTTKAINVSGVSQKNAKLILDGLAIRNGDSIFKLSANEICRNLMSKSFVKSAIVRKNLPNMIKIDVVEKIPIAVFQKNSKFFLVDCDGTVIEEVFHKPPGLPIVIGDDSNLRAGSAVDMISKFRPIADNMEYLVFIRGRRWDIILRGGTRVKLPRKNTEMALKTLSTLLKKCSIKRAKTIDLRIEGDIVIAGACDSYEAPR